MTRVYLNRIAFALGEIVREVEEAHRTGLVQSSPEQLRLAGFRSHHTCKRGTTSYDLASRAVAGLGQLPSPVGARNESCFSAVEPVMGTNQCV